MANTKQRNWKKAQPHDAGSGKFVSRKKAESNPQKVEWVTAKKGKAGK